MASSVDMKLLKQTKFPPEFNQKVDMTKVNVEVLKKWIASKISEILGNEDDVVIELCYNLLEGSRHPDIKKLQISLTGFLDKDTPKFCKELWTLCLSAQANPQGVPKELLEAKKLELIQEKRRPPKRLVNDSSKKRRKRRTSATFASANASSVGIGAMTDEEVEAGEAWTAGAHDTPDHPPGDVALQTMLIFEALPRPVKLTPTSLPTAVEDEQINAVKHSHVGSVLGHARDLGIAEVHPTRLVPAEADPFHARFHDQSLAPSHVR
ncbi:MAG: Serine/arginine repetitive matrix protein 1 [Caeruleum heppii]|nr:MAG: Serine/arginine repetitive matrix protein 1 [Caeruleum heppii]